MALEKDLYLIPYKTSFILGGLKNKIKIRDLLILNELLYQKHRENFNNVLV